MTACVQNGAARPKKRLVVCFDGTWNDADSQATETNVFRMARAIKPVGDDGVTQCVLYLRGVGTSGLVAEIVVEGAVGLGLGEILRSAYMFLAQNYEDGDEIYLFGFSRGAFTARSLTGLLSACGLLTRQRLGDLGLAWDYYRTPKPHAAAKFMEEKHTQSRPDIRVTFLGVWDTVGALGVPGTLFNAVNQDRYGFHDTGPCPAIRHGCHALAIDEQRSEFVPTFWTGPCPEGTVIEQVWFAGVHSDVGGGYRTRELADIPLAWMAQKAEAHGLCLEWGCLADTQTAQPAAPMHDSSTGAFLKDKLTPTLRRVCERDVPVAFYERLYAPLKDGVVVPTLNETMHPSVFSRYGSNAAFCTDDAGGKLETRKYLPRNLDPLLMAGE